MSLNARLQAELAANDVSPPWEVFPEYSAYTIGWRMGIGESWKHEWSEWCEGLGSREDRLSYLKTHRPAPVSFAHWVDGALSPEAEEFSDSRRAELADLGLIANDVAYGTWLANHATPPAPWDTTQHGEIALSYIAPRAAYFWSRWCRQQRECDELYPTSYEPPPRWRDLWEMVSWGTEPAALPPLHKGWPRLVYEQARHGAAPPPWVLGCSVEDVVRAQGKKAGYADAWRGWIWHVFDDQPTWREYLARWESPGDEWLTLTAKAGEGFAE